MRPRQQTANSARALRPATEVSASGVRHRRRIAAVTLLDHPHPVIHVVRLAVKKPPAYPGVFPANPKPPPPVIDKHRPPVARRFRADQLVLVVVAVGHGTGP